MVCRPGRGDVDAGTALASFKRTDCSIARGHRLPPALGDHCCRASRPGASGPSSDSRPRAYNPTCACIDEPLPVEDSQTLPALAVPSPIGVQTIAEGSATPIGDVAVMPIEIQALQVNALPEAPENRREE